MNPPPRVPTYHEGEEPSRGASPRAASTQGEDTDRDLVRRMAAGDERALGAIYTRWITLVYSLVLHLLGDSDEAEDVVEETFWQAWRQAVRYEESRGAVSTWLTTIARSRSIARLRALKRRQDVPWPRPSRSIEDHPMETAAAEGVRGSSSEGERQREGDPLVDVESAERNTIVATALGKLPPEQRETIELAYFGGLSQSEIAERMGQPLGTVKTRVRLAMEKLRDNLSMLREEAP